MELLKSPCRTTKHDLKTMITVESGLGRVREVPTSVCAPPPVSVLMLSRPCNPYGLAFLLTYLVIFNWETFFKIMIYIFLAVPFGSVGILAPQPGIISSTPALELWSPNHWTIREVPPLF